MFRLRNSIGLKLTLNFTLVILVTILIFEGIMTFGIHEYYYGNVEQVLFDRINIAVEFYNGYIKDTNLRSKSKLILENSSVPNYLELQILDLSGKVIDTSSRIYNQQIVNTEDFNLSKTGVVGVWRGKNPPTGELVMAVSAPLFSDGRIVGIARYITSIQELDSVVKRLMVYSYTIGLLVLIAALYLSTLLAKNIIDPIYELKAVADNIALGHFHVRAKRRSNDELGELADTLNYMSEEIEKSEQVKNEFISSISHEIRTPLTSIKGWSETILTGDLSNTSETQLGLQIISSETERLSDLLEDLLDFSRLDANIIRLKKEHFSIEDLCEDVLRQYLQRFKKKNVTTQLKKTAYGISIWADRNRLRQVLINLVDNSLKFTPEAGTIEIKLDLDKGYLRMIVTDTGVGIHKKDINYVTESFYKGDSKLSGTGLGLSISRKIIEMHDGYIDIQSEIGKGTSVGVYIPLGTHVETSLDL